MKKSIFSIAMCVSILLTVSSCSHDDLMPNEVVPQKAESAGITTRMISSEELEKMGIKNPYETNTSHRNTATLSNYYPLPDTGSGSANFMKSGYAIEITRKLLDGVLTIKPIVQTVSGANGVTSAYLLNSSNTVISSQLNKPVGTGANGVQPFNPIDVSGSNKVWLLFWPSSAGDFRYDY